MDIQEAILILAGVIDGYRNDALIVVMNAVVPLTNTDASEIGGWMYDREYEASETPESIADEWDALSVDYN